MLEKTCGCIARSMVSSWVHKYGSRFRPPRSCDFEWVIWKCEYSSCDTGMGSCRDVMAMVRTWAYGDAYNVLDCAAPSGRSKQPYKACGVQECCPLKNKPDVYWCLRFPPPLLFRRWQYCNWLPLLFMSDWLGQPPRAFGFTGNFFCVTRKERKYRYQQGTDRKKCFGVGKQLFIPAVR